MRPFPRSLASLLARAAAASSLALLALVPGACTDAPTAPRDAADVARLRVTAALVGTPVATIAVTVAAPDIVTPLVYNLTVRNDTASGTIAVPVGPARTISVVAADQRGEITHEGSRTVDIVPGTNPPLSIPLLPRNGQLPITIVFGTITVMPYPGDQTVTLGDTIGYRPFVFDEERNWIDVPVQWATTNPGIATIDSTGRLVTWSAGTVEVVATYQGYAGRVTLTVAPGKLTEVGIGFGSGCGLTPKGAVYCWGRNNEGELGIGATTPAQSAFPVAVTGGRRYTAVGVADFRACALDAAGLAYCWGDNWNSAFVESDNVVEAPTAVVGGRAYASLAVGADNVCALTSAGAGYCWGYGGDGQLGNGTNTFISNTPVQVSVGRALTRIAVTIERGNQAHNCAIDVTGLAWCWGANEYGQLGDGTVTNRNVPVTISGSRTWTDVAVSGRHSCAIATGGAAWCWGDNREGQLGVDTAGTKRSSVPVQVAGSHTFAAIAAAGDFTCALDTDGAAWCWGTDFTWQGEDPAGAHVPRRIEGEHRFTKITASTWSICAIDDQNIAWCWGDNGYGQFGTGTTNQHVAAPERVRFDYLRPF